MKEEEEGFALTTTAPRPVVLHWSPEPPTTSLHTVLGRIGWWLCVIDYSNDQTLQPTAETMSWQLAAHISRPPATSVH